MWARGKAKTTKLDQDKEDNMNKQPGSTKLAAKKKKKGCYLNLKTYKLHALGHYTQTIWHFGLTDGYSTQPVSSSDIMHFPLMVMDCQGEAEHQKVKKYYKWASKHAFTHGIAKQNWQERTLHKMHDWKRAHDLIDSTTEPQATDHPSKKSATPSFTSRTKRNYPTLCQRYIITCPQRWSTKFN